MRRPKSPSGATQTSSISQRQARSRATSSTSTSVLGPRVQPRHLSAFQREALLAARMELAELAAHATHAVVLAGPARPPVDKPPADRPLAGPARRDAISTPAEGLASRAFRRGAAPQPMFPRVARIFSPVPRAADVVVAETIPLVTYAGTLRRIVLRVANSAVCRITIRGGIFTRTKLSERPAW